MTTPEEPLEAVADRYVLVERLGGGEGREVWRSHDDHAGRDVVLTRYRNVDEDWRAVFGRRARQLEALSDPGIASVLAHDATSDEPWLVTAYVDGETAATVHDDPGLSSDDALAVVGQTALALAAPHSAGVGHGNLTPDTVLIRPDGSVALIDFAVDRSPAPGDDLAALSRMSHLLLDHTADEHAADITGFMRLLDGGDWRDPTDIGRTALALAAAQRVHGTAGLVPESVDTEDETAVEPPRPWYDEDERKRVRNRLIALGAIVVIGGAALLRIFTAGSGETTVPSVIGEPFGQAQHDLNQAGLRDSERLTTGPAGSENTVLAQDPRAGQRAKIGSVVSLTVAQADPG